MTQDTILAPYACHPGQTRGRQHGESEDPLRTVFQRDRDRIVHSVAFRRLKYKTQVFVNHEGDHFRTRLTHSLEVSQVSRSLASALRLNTDLAEALALAHDLGHPPFGHAGEEALDAAMKPWGGFRHNEQTIRVMTRLEHRYARFPGLNLTWETLEGTIKHNGPLSDAPPEIAALEEQFPLELSTWPSLEAQIASLSDDIAYCAHDLDDGLRAGMFTLADLAPLPLIGEIFTECGEKFAGATPAQRQHEAIRRVMRCLIADLLEETRRLVAEANPASADAVRHAGRALAGFRPGTSQALQAIKAFLMARMYRHWRVNRMSYRAGRVLDGLFHVFLSHPGCLPEEWQPGPREEVGEAALPRRIADYLAGMTDRYALKEYDRLFNMQSLQL